MTLEPTEKLLDLESPLILGAGGFALDFDHAVFTPGDEYYDGGIVRLYTVTISSPYNPELLEHRDRYSLAASYLESKGLLVST